MVGGNGSAAFADIDSGSPQAVMRNHFSLGRFELAERLDNLIVGPSGGPNVAEPASTLDTRFSDPRSTATSWSETQRVLKDAQLFWITTVRADGRPHVSPLVAVWLDHSLFFSTGGTEQKALNLGANRNVILTTGCNGWDRGLDVVVEGVAEQVTDDGLLGRLARAWSEKWDGRWQYEANEGLFHHPTGGDALVYGVHPLKILAFGKGTFTHTTYRF